MALPPYLTTTILSRNLLQPRQRTGQDVRLLQCAQITVWYVTSCS